MKRNQVFSTVLAFLLIASVVNIVFGYKILHGEDIYGDMDVWLNTENNTAYQTRELGSPIYCENPNPCEDVRHFDCSGLVYFVFQYSLGIRAELGRLGASDYYSECFTVGENIADANVGDLLFSWSNEEGDIVHVGIVTERPSSTSFKVVHASGGRHSVVEDNRGIPNSFWTDWGDFAGNITRTQIVASARAQIGAHYLWGAEGDIPLWWEIVGNETGVGGIVIPVDKFALLAPYISLASTAMIGAVATAVYVKRVKRRKEKRWTLLNRAQSSTPFLPWKIRSHHV